MNVEIVDVIECCGIVFGFVEEFFVFFDCCFDFVFGNEFFGGLLIVVME